MPPFELDVARNGEGAFVGTISVAAQRVQGLPLTKVVVDGASIAFHARTDQPFNAVLSADGTSMSGSYNLEGHSLSFSATRVGEPRFETPLTSAPIGKELEGVWKGALGGEGIGPRIVLTLSNQADGRASGRMVNLDEGGLEIPLAIEQKGSNVALTTTVVPGSFSGALNDSGTELAGTYREGTQVIPLTFRRSDDHLAR